MNPDDLARILDELGQRLGPSGEYVFALAVRQVYVNAVVAAVVVVLCLLPLLFLPRLLRWVNDGGSSEDRDLVFLPVGLIYGLLLLIAFVIALVTIPAVLNPEYAALRDILGTIGVAR